MAEQSANRELIHCLPFSPYRLLLPARERLDSMPTKNSFVSPSHAEVRRRHLDGGRDLRPSASNGLPGLAGILEVDNDGYPLFLDAQR